MQTDCLDWDKGLPPDVLALVAKAGGLSQMIGMRGVSKTWQLGFELGVTGIRVSQLDPLLPEGTAAFCRFPVVQKLNLRDSATQNAWLQTLRVFPKLNSLVLGYTTRTTSGYSSSKVASPLSLTRRLSDAGLAFLRGLQLEHLDLSGCTLLTSDGMAAVLQGMPLTSLNLNGVPPVTDAVLQSLKGAPLQTLDLEADLDPDDSQMTDAGLEALRGMPLTWLSLKWRLYLTPEGLRSLRGLPLTSLNLSRCAGLVSDAAMEALRGLPLAHISLHCGYDEGAEYLERDLTDVGMGVLASFPLTSLTVSQ